MSIPLSNSAVTSFYSKEEREELIRINQQELEEIKKAKNSDNPQAAIKAMEKSERQLHELYKRVKRRYIEAFKGDMDAILADASAILQTVRKKHFQDEIGTIRSLTPNEEEIIEFYNDQPEPQRSEKIQRAKDMIKAKRKAAAANYENCYNYLLLYLDAQIEALQYYGLPLSGLEELTAAKASEWYKKPRSKQKESTAHIEKAVEQAKKLFYDMPTSSASHLLLDILSSGDSIADLPERKKQVSHGAKYEVKASGNKRLVSMENYEGTAKMTVELTDINKLTKPAIMLLVYVLVKANEQALHNGELTKDHISFPLQSLIDDGLYKTIQSARRGFLTGRDALTSLQIKGQLQERKGSKNAVKVDDLIVPFIKGGIKNNQCYMYLNPYMDWEFFAQYFTKLPKYIFSLSDRAGLFLYYIFYLARQHTSEIESRKYFTISFRAIHSLLKLPSEKGLNNPQRDIKDAIENAVEEIEEAHRKMYGNNEFSFRLVSDKKAGISEYLDNGYLEVSLTGAFAEPFISQSQERQKKIQQAEQKKARIEEKATAMKIAKEDKKET